MADLTNSSVDLIFNVLVGIGVCKATKTDRNDLYEEMINNGGKCPESIRAEIEAKVLNCSVRFDDQGNNPEWGQSFVSRIAEENACVKRFVQDAILPANVKRIKDFDSRFSNLLMSIECMTSDAADVIIEGLAHGTAERMVVQAFGKGKNVSDTEYGDVEKLCRDLTVLRPEGYLEQKLREVLADVDCFGADADAVWNAPIDKDSPLLKDDRIRKVYAKERDKDITIGDLLKSYAKSVRNAQVKTFYEERDKEEDQMKLPGNSPQKLGNMLGQGGIKRTESKTGQLPAHIRPTPEKVAAAATVQEPYFRGFQELFKRIEGTVADMFDGIQTVGLVSKLTGIDFNVSADAYYIEDKEERSRAIREASDAKPWRRQGGKADWNLLKEYYKYTKCEKYLQRDGSDTDSKHLYIRECKENGHIPTAYAGTEFQKFWDEVQLEMKAAKIEALSVQTEMKKRAEVLAGTLLPADYIKDADYAKLCYEFDYLKKKSEAADKKLTEAVADIAANENFKNSTPYFNRMRADIVMLSNLVPEKSPATADEMAAREAEKKQFETAAENYFFNRDFETKLKENALHMTVIDYLKKKGNTSPNEAEYQGEKTRVSAQLSAGDAGVVGDYENMKSIAAAAWEQPDDSDKSKTKKDVFMAKLKRGAIEEIYKELMHNGPAADSWKIAGVKAIETVKDFCNSNDPAQKEQSYMMTKVLIGLEHRKDDIGKPEIDALLNKTKDGIKYNPDVLQRYADELSRGMSAGEFSLYTDDVADNLLSVKYAAEKAKYEIRQGTYQYMGWEAR
jgi:hypothetical protein